MTAATVVIQPSDLDYAATSELMIKGNGYFVVRDPASSHCYAVHAGKFTVDTEGYLVTPTGARLQGRLGANLAETGDLQIGVRHVAKKGNPDSGVLFYEIDKTGRIIVHLTDGGSFLCGQIMLQNFSEPDALVKAEGQMFSHIDQAGPLPAAMAPGSHGLGTVFTTMLEFSRAAGPCWRN